MTLTEAARLLELAPDAAPEQLETRFLELRTKLEEKIGKAPTPGLKEKYRASLVEITTAFETLTLAADGSDLPVLQRAERKPNVGAAPVKPSGASELEAPATKPGSAAKKGGNREFLLVAAIAVVVLIGGGWFVLKTRQEAADKARVEAATKAEAEKEKARQEAMFGQLRATQAELKIRWDGIEKDLTTSERKLAELKADARNTKDMPAPQVAELQAQYTAQGDYVEWLQQYVSRHPGKTQLAKLDALLTAKAGNEAAQQASELGQSLKAAEEEITGQKKALLALGRPMQITTEPAGLRYRVLDAYGRTMEGVSPGTVMAPWGRAEVVVSSPGPGWAEERRELRIVRDLEAAVKVAYIPGALAIKSEPSGATVLIGTDQVGVTPLKVEGLSTGEKTITLKLKGYEEMTAKVVVRAGETVEQGGELVKTEPPRVGRAYTIPNLGLKLMPITAGSFSMGSPNGDSDEKPVTRVTISRPYWLGATEVTQAEWAAVMGNNPSHFKGGNLPVEQVSYDDVLEFCRKLTERERAADRLPEGYEYTLPTEAQWEYACRAGTTGAYAGSLDAMGWYDANSGSKTHEVGGKQANGWGLYDMHGNVWEWCLDRSGAYPGGSVTDPRGASSGSFRVIRGGSWYFVAGYCRSAYRGGGTPGGRNISVLGVRLALSSETIR